MTRLLHSGYRRTRHDDHVPESTPASPRTPTPRIRPTFSFDTLRIPEVSAGRVLELVWPTSAPGEEEKGSCDALMIRGNRCLFAWLLRVTRLLSENAEVSYFYKRLGLGRSMPQESVGSMRNDIQYALSLSSSVLLLRWNAKLLVITSLVPVTSSADDRDGKGPAQQTLLLASAKQEENDPAGGDAWKVTGEEDMEIVAVGMIGPREFGTLRLPLQELVRPSSRNSIVDCILQARIPMIASRTGSLM
eukprot:CAMPEP_0184492062 /NCGR_PEP_ID=MMETSP0113_2-20130426/22196_1 /TAXON_ID=91329 /ORGANISM="Norrisiella sphaerica, Strain BC52" /LENGTH=246 /DNA_ID=CAMNT_0026876697 /DNA_START=55 /DNA_END=795 /DNA_ORIENTATION=-